MRQLNEIHQVGREMVHLAIQPVEESGEWLCLIEGGGVCLGNSFLEWRTAETWMRNMFGRIFTGHRCDLGCIRLPHSEFLAGEGVLERLAGLSAESEPRP